MAGTLVVLVIVLIVRLPAVLLALAASFLPGRPQRAGREDGELVTHPRLRRRVLPSGGITERKLKPKARWPPKEELDRAQAAICASTGVTGGGGRCSGMWPHPAAALDSGHLSACRSVAGVPADALRHHDHLVISRRGRS